MEEAPAPACALGLVQRGGQAVAARAPERVHVTRSVPVAVRMGRGFGGWNGEREREGNGVVLCQRWEEYPAPGRANARKNRFETKKKGLLF